MSFILAKIVYFLLAPFNWILALFIWSLFVKSPLFKKRLVTLIILLVFFFGNEVIYTRLVLAWQPKQVQIDDNQLYEAGILLGGLSAFDKNGKGFLNAATDRLVEATILYKTKKIKRIIISGGSIKSNRPKEAEFLYKQLLLLGVPKEDLIVENRSRTTFENAVYTKKIIDSLKLRPPYVLITSAMHIPRADKVFTKAGFQVVPFPSDFHVFDKKFNFSDYIIPDARTLDDWNIFLKEVVGIVGYKLLNKA